ncbi:arginine deiminase family protein [Gammaproteobacteria bacterium]|nr:arginine deiminase family protein [Gammaproteobacteria bacterium]
MNILNEFSKITEVAIRSPLSSFIDNDKILNEWKALRFHAKPNLKRAMIEYTHFKGLLEDDGISIIDLPSSKLLTIDSIYTRDSILISKGGLILCNMGRSSRTPEAGANFNILASQGYKMAGQIKAPGTLEGGDFIWIDDHHAAVGLGPRTNAEGIRQLKEILGPSVELHIVNLPQPSHPDDVLHLMSIISPLDKDLSLIYKPFMPESFTNWLSNLGIKFIEVSDKEYLLMGCNVLATSPRSIIMLEQLPCVQSELERAGCKIRTYKGMEISRKGEGGPTCLTRPLRRKK